MGSESTSSSKAPLDVLLDQPLRHFWQTSIVYCLLQDKEHLKGLFSACLERAQRRPQLRVHKWMPLLNEI